MNSHSHLEQTLSKHSWLEVFAPPEIKALSQVFQMRQSVHRWLDCLQMLQSLLRDTLSHFYVFVQCVFTWGFSMTSCHEYHNISAPDRVGPVTLNQD